MFPALFVLVYTVDEDMPLAVLMGVEGFAPGRPAVWFPRGGDRVLYVHETHVVVGAAS
jgi:hypothetical protein